MRTRAGGAAAMRNERREDRQSLRLSLQRGGGGTQRTKQAFTVRDIL